MAVKDKKKVEEPKVEGTDLERAVSELDDIVKTEGGEKKVPDLVDTLAQAAADSAATAAALVKGELVVSGKHVEKPDEGAAVDQPAENKARRGGDESDEDEDDKDDEDDEGKSLGDEDDIAKAFMDGLEEHVELLDVSPALLALAESMAKSVSSRSKEQTEIRLAIAGLSKAVGIIAKSHVEIHKVLKGIQVKAPMPGIVGLVDGKAVSDATGTGDFKVDKGDGTKMSKAELQERVSKAVQEGKLTPYSLAQLDSPLGLEALLSSIPEDVAKSYGIPRKSA